MKFWGWVLRILVVALGVGLFVLQSQSVKKSMLEFIVNQPFKKSVLKVEATGIRGLFPFQFTVASLDLKEGEHCLATLSDILVFWSVPALANLEVKVNVEKRNELAGDITYVIDKHALFSRLQGEGLQIGSKLLPEMRGMVKSIALDFPTLDLLKGQVMATLYDDRDHDQEPATLTVWLQELDEDRLNIQEILLTGKNVTGKGYGAIYPRQGLWEGKADIAVATLTPYSRWVCKGTPKELVGSATLKCQKPLKGQATLDLGLEHFHYGNFEAKVLKGQAIVSGKDQAEFAIQGRDAVFNAVPLTTLSATGNLDKEKGYFDFTGTGKQNISLHARGVVELSKKTSQTQVTLTRAELTHPMHSFSLKQPATLSWGEKGIRAPKLWLKTGEGTIAIQDLIVGEELSGSLSIDRLPLTLLRVINPEWIASGALSGKGKLKGTMDSPTVNLFLEGKSLHWGASAKPRAPEAVSSRFLGIDLSGTLALSGGLFTWEVKLTSGRLLALASQGEVSVDKWYPTATSSLEATLKGRGDMSIISLFMPYGDLIQGQASVDLTGACTLKNPLIKGHVSVVNGLYESALFGTLIRNIKIQGNASGDRVTLSSITGKDNAKGHVKGHGSVTFTSLLNPDIDLHLLLDQLLVVQNDEISAKANGILKLQGTLWGDSQAKAKITGDVILHPLVVRLDEYAGKIATIHLVEKKPNGVRQAPKEPHKPKGMRKGSSFFPLDITLTSPEEIYLRGYGFDAQWKGKMNAVGTIADPQLVGEITLVKGKFDLFGKPLKLTEGRVAYSREPKNDPLLSIVGTRDMGEITATMRIEGHASNPKITFSSNTAVPQEEILAQLLFGRGFEGISPTQSLLLANALNTFKGKNNLNLTNKLRSAVGLDVLEFKEKKPTDGDEFKSATQQVSIGKQISDKVYLSLDQSVSGDGGTSATIQFDVTSSLKMQADIGGDKNTGVGFAWVKKY